MSSTISMGSNIEPRTMDWLATVFAQPVTLPSASSEARRWWTVSGR